MTDTIITQSESVLVAIDIAKSRHEVLLQIPGKQHRRRFTILNQLADFNRLIVWVQTKLHDQEVCDFGWNDFAGLQ